MSGTGRKRLTLLVEGDGDVRAVPALINNLLVKHAGTTELYTGNPMRVGNLFSLVNGSEAEWLRYVAIAAKHRDLGGVLLLIDGDCDDKIIRTSSGKMKFCAWTIADVLARRAADVGAGRQFSLAVVFARQEYESWLIAGVPDKELCLKANVDVLDKAGLEESPRGAKEWLNKSRIDGYKPTQHQESLTRKLDLQVLSQRMRSFRRLEHAIRVLIEAIRTGRHILSPTR